MFNQIVLLQVIMNSVFDRGFVYVSSVGVPHWPIYTLVLSTEECKRVKWKKLQSSPNLFLHFEFLHRGITLIQPLEYYPMIFLIY